MELSDLQHPTIAVRNKKGEVIFALKRKDKYPPLYYLFEKHPDRCSSDEERANLEAVFSGITAMAGRLGLPLHDMGEINEAISAQIRIIRESEEGKAAMKKLEETGEQAFVKDIKIKVFNHATGRIGTMEIGVSLPTKAGAAKILEDMKNVGTDNEQGTNQETE